jgi:DNA replicative helicase MCM subunit Mcm2 (Cdc46/Mcm family)
MRKKILITVAVLLVIIQFIHPERNKASEPQANALTTLIKVPDNIKNIFAKACNDCHSNNTRYPWYSRIQPVDWWMNNHVREGKRELNFDEYASKSLRYQYHKMEEIVDEVKEGEMPLDSYTWMHRDARLTETEKKEVIDWAKNVRENMESKYPRDSLIRKKQ